VFGRRQLFRFVASRSTLDQEIFEAAFQRCAKLHEIWNDLTQKGFDFSYRELQERVEELRNLMSFRQLWLLSASRVPIESLDLDEESSSRTEVIDPLPDPERMAILKETRTALARALRVVDPSDHLLLRLRYLEGLGLVEVARLVGLKDAQTADRRIREAIEHLREKIDKEKVLLGKRKSASV